MKLCRFELLTDAGQVRSGIVHNGKIYETDGAQPIAVHEAADVRPLPPIGLPPTVRMFRADAIPERGLQYVYGNPSTLVGASQIVPLPDFAGRVEFEPHIACVIALPAANVALEHADDLVLGITIVNLLVSRDTERMDGRGSARSLDFGTAIGPVLTTPEELDDLVEDEQFGRRYKLPAVGRVNGVETLRGDTGDLPFTFAQMIAFASESWPLQTGDVLTIGPIADPIDAVSALSPGDEIQVAVDKLGTLSTKIAL